MHSQQNVKKKKLTRNLPNQQCVRCCVYKVPLRFWINTVGQEINLQCEKDAVYV